MLTYMHSLAFRATHVPALRYDRDHGKTMPLADLKIILVVRRSDLDDARSEVRIHALVGNDRKKAVR